MPQACRSLPENPGARDGLADAWRRHPRVRQRSEAGAPGSQATEPRLIGSSPVIER
jgi:hypothetical protein